MKLAGLRSRHNTYMSVPLLWAMIGQHTTYFAGGNLGIPSDLLLGFWLVIIIIGWHIVFQCYKKAAKFKDSKTDDEKWAQRQFLCNIPLSTVDSTIRFVITSRGAQPAAREA